MKKRLLLAAGTVLAAASAALLSCSGETSEAVSETDAIAESVVDLVDGNMVGVYTLGTKAGMILSAEIPDYYTSRSHTDLAKLTQKDSICEIGGIGYFNANLAVADWDNEAYAYKYYWNSHSRLGAVLLSLETLNEWGKPGFDSLVQGFETKGFDLAEEGKHEGAYTALLTKGMEFIYIQAPEKGKGCYIWVADKNVDGMENLYDNLRGTVAVKP